MSARSASERSPAMKLLLPLLIGALLTIPLSAFFLYIYFSGPPLPRWTSFMLGLTVFFGLHFLMMGVIGD